MKSQLSQHFKGHPTSIQPRRVGAVTRVSAASKPLQAEPKQIADIMSTIQIIYLLSKVS